GPLPWQRRRSSASLYAKNSLRLKTRCSSQRWRPTMPNRSSPVFHMPFLHRHCALLTQTILHPIASFSDVGRLIPSLSNGANAEPDELKRNSKCHDAWIQMNSH